LFLEGKRVHILDVASGPGRYVLELMARRKDIQMSATLRDYQQENLDAARALAESLKVTTATMLLADAFDRTSIAATPPRPTVAITSGIYELFPENDRVLRSLQGIADTLEPGGFLIYTGQIWHPQVEFIARVLRNREGQPWIMRRRTQAEMDQLVEAVGFEKIAMEIDRWGIFTVSLARKKR
jgi:SAM-dependent methyltransferase